MWADDEQKRRTADAVGLAILTVGACLLGLGGPPQAGAQNTATPSHVVTVKSDPPGAMIWKEEGRGYTCTGTLTPSTVELAFHGENDVQRLRVRRFGYSSVDLDVKSTDKEVEAGLNLLKSASSSFLVESDAPPDVKQLSEVLKKEFGNILLTDPEAFRCSPFDLDSVQVTKGKETGAVGLTVALWLDRSFGGLAFRQAHHAFNEQDRKQRMGRIALDSGIAETLVQFHRLASKSPDVKDIIVIGFYSTTEARLDTEKARTLSIQSRTVQGPFGVSQQQSYAVWGKAEQDVVKNRDAEGAITIVMPTARIPDTTDTKAISDAVLAVGKISFTESDDSASKLPPARR